MGDGLKLEMMSLGLEFGLEAKMCLPIDALVYLIVHPTGERECIKLSLRRGRSVMKGTGGEGRHGSLVLHQDEDTGAGGIERQWLMENELTVF